ncbi:MAG TPA: serine/threonine-protein kinase, partial [Variovorax sp.]|nr:serine/threonine-protein kinase [Variovorax sp.]
MDASRWSQLSPLLDELLELDDTLRERRLAQLQQGDAELAAELRRLLAMERHSASFIAEPLLAHHEQLVAAGDRIGDYRLLELLGEGGMGQVWLAVDMQHPERGRIALKLMRPDLADPHLHARFLRERDTLAALDHAQIPHLHEAGADAAGTLYLALEYAPGEPITEYCRRHALPLTACVSLFVQVCNALEHVHARGIVHRDLKPANILVDTAGQVRLLDFGIALHLDDPNDQVSLGQARAFTLHYAAPEQIRGEPVSASADVYSLGVVLYEVLTGQKPYRLRRQSDAEWERAVLQAEVAPPSAMVLRGANGSAGSMSRRSAGLRGALDAITLKTLRKAPDDRYASV